MYALTRLTIAALSADLDCQRCGACYAVFRVSFYWAEADDAPGGTVPVALTRPARCVALQGEVGRAVACGIYAQRASTCREVQPGDEQCLKARAAHRLESGPAAITSAGLAPSGHAPAIS